MKWFNRKSIILLIVGMSMAFFIVKEAFCFTRTWDNTDPIDHVLNSLWPAEIREVMVDVSERLDDIMNGFTSGDTVTDFNRVPLNNRVADDTAVADTLILYSKDVSAKAELFAIDEDSNVLQITSAGALNVTQAQVCTNAYPVGSVYIATVSTNPATLLGCGTWAAYGEGRVLVGVGTSDAAYAAAATGGESTHTLTAAESGTTAHTHGIVRKNNGAVSTANGFLSSDTVTNDNPGTTDASSAASASSAHNNMPPYIVCYIWQRSS